MAVSPFALRAGSPYISGEFWGARGNAGYPAKKGNKMARKPTARTEYVLFNVYYEDGSQRSNRRVPAELLGGIDGDEPARALIEEQDREISAKSGMPPLTIKRIVRVDDDVKERARDTRRANERRAG
jgi:hypothetical protein